MEPTTYPIQPAADLSATAGNTHRDHKLVLTVVEAAEVLGISRGLAYELVRQGAIPSVRLGRRLLVPRQRLEELLATGSPS